MGAQPLSLAVTSGADDQEFKILYAGKIDQTPIQSSIAIANQRLFIRTAQNLYAVGK